MAADSLSDAIAQAQKILGADATIPKVRVDIDDLWSKSSEAWEEFEEARGALEDKILAYENTMSTIKNSVKQAAATFEKDDFNLDEKNKDNQKKIKQAQKIFSEYFAAQQSDVDKGMKVLDDLDKHVVQLEKYKNPSK